MATFVDVGLIGSAANGGDVTLSLAGAQEGDLVVLFGGHNATSGTPGPVTAGYDPLVTLHDTNIDGEPALGVWTKFMGPSPDASVVGEGNGSSLAAVVYGRYIIRGVDPTILDAAAVKVVTTTGFANPGAVVTQTPNALVLVVLADVSSSGTPTAAPSGYSNFLAKRQSDSRPYTMGVATKEVASPGSEDPGLFTWNTSFSGRFQVVFTIAVRDQGAAGAKPLAPTLSMQAGAGFVQWNQSEFQPHPDDPTDTQTAAKYQLSTTEDFSSLVVDETLGAANFTSYRRESVAAGTYYGRSAQVGEVFTSEWSNVVQVEVAAGVTAGDTPTLSLVEKAHDYIEVEISQYNHPDGEVEPSQFDGDNPKPWHQLSEIQARLASDPDWSTPLETVEVAYVEGSVESRRVRFDLSGHAAGTAFKFRGRQLDGHLAVYTAYSADLNQSTDAAPANAPLKPTVDITCGRSIVMSGGTYQHASSGPGTNHGKTQARICYGGKCQTVTVNSPAESFTWPGNPPGSASVYLRYGDDSTPTRYGPWSDADVCSVPKYPPTADFTSPTSPVIRANAMITWTFNDSEIAWLSNIQRSVNGGAYQVIATNQVAMSTPFNISGLDDGDYEYRVQAVNPTTGELGEWASLPLILDRNRETRVYHKTAAQLAQAPGRQIWDDETHVAWTGVPGEGVIATRVHSGSTVRRSGRVFDEHGEPDEYDIIVRKEHIPDECEWYPHRFANAYITCGGPMANGVDGAPGTRSGRMALVSVGIQPWYLGGPNAPCMSDSIRDQGLALTAKRSITHPNNQWRYGRSYGRGKLKFVTARNGTSSLTHASATLPSSTSPDIGGPIVYTDPNNEIGNARRPMHVLLRVRRTAEGGQPGRTFQTRFMGAGVEAQQWHHEEFVADVDSQGRTIPCGACGLAFEDMDETGVGRSEGILFSAYTLRVISYGTCETVEEPCQAGHALCQALSMERRVADHHVEYQVIGAVPCPAEEE